MPELERRGVPVLLPSAWVRAPARIRANVSAQRRRAVERPPLDRRRSRSFDWRLAVGDVDLGEDELAELAAAKSPVVRVAGRWQALRQADVQRALRFLERRKRGGGVVDLVRTVSGLETDEAGLDLGDVTLDRALAELLDGDARFEPLGDAEGDAVRPVRLPGARSRLAAPARRPRDRRDPRRRHGARQDGAGDRDAPLRARERRARSGRRSSSAR